MYTIMQQHSSNLIQSLHKKVKADEVIEVKEWVMFHEIWTQIFLLSSSGYWFDWLFLLLIPESANWNNMFFCLFFAEYLDPTVWMLWPALPSVWTLIPSIGPLILLSQTLRKWSSSTFWTRCLWSLVCQTLCSDQIVFLVLLSPGLMTSFLFLFISVLFPFMGPVFEKMNFSFFPAEVLEFFYKFLGTIKSDRQKNHHKVMCTQCMAAVAWMLVVDPFF